MITDEDNQPKLRNEAGGNERDGWMTMIDLSNKRRLRKDKDDWLEIGNEGGKK
jgi:hypothetical protein